MRHQLINLLVPGCLGVTTLLALSDIGRADTIAHYRFESDLVTDSSGNGHTLEIVGSPLQALIGGEMPGSDFPNPVPLTGDPNTGMVDFQAVGDGLRRTFDGSVVEGSLTIQAFINANSFPGTFASIIVENLDDCCAPTAGMGLQVRNDGLFGTVPGELMFVAFDPDGNTHNTGSGFVMSPGKDYYVAASFDDCLNRVVFYRQNLTDGTAWESSTVNIGGTWDLAGTETLSIGGDFEVAIAGLTWDGLIDEVHISDVALAQHELLMAFEESKDEPAPEDINEDGAVDVVDLVAIVLAWGPCDPCCPEDIDRDGQVAVTDLVLVILAWG